MDNDISAILEGWHYKSGQVVVRKIKGIDGRDKIQLRVDLGLLQMELDGRPDGKRPHDKESLLDHYLAQRENHKAKFGSDAGFVLDADDCFALQEEALQYYHRYLSLLAVRDYARAERDTARNLRVFDLVWKHAVREADKWALERHRPYVLMMNTRARASAALQKDDPEQAIRHIQEGIERIEQFFEDREQQKRQRTSGELAFLKAWLNEIKENKPPSEADRLRDELQWAVDVEDYERAAKIRDQIRRLETPED